MDFYQPKEQTVQRVPHLAFALKVVAIPPYGIWSFRWL